MSKTKEEIYKDHYMKTLGSKKSVMVKAILPAMDEYAKQEAIEFFLDTTGGYMFKDNAEQLYQQFINSKMPSKVK